MFLSDRQVAKANMLHVSIKCLCEKQPDFVKLLEIEKCDKCKGTGLSDYGILSGDNSYWWQPGCYCDDCKGVGYINLMYLTERSIDGANYICSGCYGIGCENCDQTGIVSWTRRARGRV